MSGGLGGVTPHTQQPTTKLTIMTTNTLIPNPAINNRSRDVQTAEIADQTWVFRSRTWDRLKFEIEYARQRGTTANSYLICGVDTPVAKSEGFLVH